jgi:uncharacterized MAPEG superfamily protein
VVLASKTSQITAIAACTWLGARVIYLPLYAMGIPVIRTIVWAAGTISLLVVLWALLR